MCVERGAIRRRDFNIGACLLFDFLQGFSDDERSCEGNESVDVVGVDDATLVEIFGDEFKERFIENGEFPADFVEAFFTHSVLCEDTNAGSGLWRELLHQFILLYEDVLCSFYYIVVHMLRYGKREYKEGGDKAS
ncbi:MAG: hypothetical protein J7J91_00710 [Deltaproteobacteria bacterium]|nr:hypothetical protein [Deltaproteobacteria bacterium]